MDRREGLPRSIEAALSARTMRGYYWALLRRVPGVLWQSWNKAITFLAALVAVLALVNREAARDVTNWHGFSPFWALAPFGLLVFYGLLRANYEAFDAIRQRVPDADARALSELSDLGLGTRGVRISRDALIYLMHRPHEDAAYEAETVATFNSDFTPRLLELFDALEARGLVESHERRHLESVTTSRGAHSIASYLRGAADTLAKAAK
jgi:hypothetical protein